MEPKLMIRTLVFTILLLSSSTSTAAPKTVAVDAGFDPNRLQYVEIAITKAIEKRDIPGAVVLVIRNGIPAYYESFGFSNLETRKPLHKDSIFRIASMTKAVTTVAVMMLYEEGHFLLSDPIADYLPEFSDPVVATNINADGKVVTSRPAERDIRIMDLLTHSSGIAYPFLPSATNRAYKQAGIIDGITAKGTTLDANIKLVASQPLMFDPGTGFAYGLNTDVLGRLVEVVSGKSLDQFFVDRIFEPLSMNDTYFYLPPEKNERLVTLYADPNGNGIAPARGNEGDIILDNPDYPISGERVHFSGGAGLSSTASDYARFLSMLLNEGRLDGSRLLSRKSVELLRTGRVDMDRDGDADFSLGFIVDESLAENSELTSVGAYAWGGAFYTHYHVDPAEQMIIVFMSQVRPTESTIKERVKVLIYQSLR